LRIRPSLEIREERFMPQICGNSLILHNFENRPFLEIRGEK
jgi:hypothetical protein